MSRPRSSAGYGRPKSNSGQDADSTSSNGGARNKAVLDRPSSRGIHGDVNRSKRQIVGQYMIGKTIGEGTFGKVKLAVHIPTGEKVAIKILEKNRIKEQADVRRVNREIKILKKARHGNIIQLYEVLDTKNTIYLIMECAEGGEMFDFIVAQKRVEEKQACRFFHQIIDGIEVIHRNEITHRDLKPENLLLKATPDGWVVKIVDFGLSNTHEGGKLLATACGSPCYAAPEMIAGKKYFGPLADLWSIGVILFALVSGYLPFEDPNTSVLYKKILAGDYQTPNWISPEVKDLIACILEVDPKKRYTVENIRKHPWYNIVSESSIPRDVCTSTEQSRAETLSTMVKAGMDAQAVLDGVASQAFNGLTAMYYLLEQKHHVRRLKKAESMKSQIRQNSSNLSKPETGSDTTESNKPQASQVSQVSQIPTQQQVPSVQGQQKNTAPIKLTSIEPLAPIMVNVPVEKPARDDKNVPIRTFVPVTPYLQAPLILQQQQLQQQQNQRQAHNNMPSLDAYLRGGVELPQNVGNNAELGGYYGNNAPSKPNVGSVVVPPLNLRTNKVNTNNATSASMAMATGSLLGSKPTALTSQTARGPAPSAAAPHLVQHDNNASNYAHPHTARTPLPSDMPVEILERPNTRRSHLRSRGGEHAVELAPAQGLSPGEGLDSMPPTRETAPQMPVRRPEPGLSTAGSAAVADKSNAEGSPTAAMALLVISNKKATNEQPASGAPATIAVATPVAPEAPRSSAGASSSGVFAGRRGRNIAGANAGNTEAAPAGNPPSSATPTATDTSVQPAPPAGSRPQPRPAALQAKLAGQPNLAPLAPIIPSPVVSEEHTAITNPQ